MTETASAAGIHTGNTARSPYWSRRAARVFYVTIKREGKGHAPLLGPYETHQEALDNVDRGNRLACAADSWAGFDAFGTCSAPRSQTVKPVFGA